MPATSESLIEQIRLVKEQIESATSRGEDPRELLLKYKELWESFSSAQKTLNEGKQILKG
jgi:hypothetical protein